MKAVEIFGVIGAAIFGLIFLAFSPDPASGWGPCGLRSIYPIQFPQVTPEGYYCLDCYECVVVPAGAFLLACYLLIVFSIVGALAAKIGNEISPIRGALAAALASGLSLVWLVQTSYSVNLIPTVCWGILIIVGATITGFGGGYVTKRRA